MYMRVKGYTYSTNYSMVNGKIRFPPKFTFLEGCICICACHELFFCCWNWCFPPNSLNDHRTLIVCGKMCSFLLGQIVARWLNTVHWILRNDERWSDVVRWLGLNVMSLTVPDFINTRRTCMYLNWIFLNCYIPVIIIVISIYMYLGTCKYDVNVTGTCINIYKNIIMTL